MTKLLLDILAVFLLLINGIGAIYGGANLVAFPDGSSIGLSLSWLEHSPFENYFVPGIVLLLANGLLSMIAVAAILIGALISALLVVLQGILLTGWILVQMLLIQTVYFLHVVMGTIGVLLMVIGWLRLSLERRQALK